ncbi:immunoglobulin-like domain-containing protein [Bradyrhizobium cajani]|uniref:immunoglobulin-like domain-containing protein n=2 Tax=Bradyrhizobium cajani TaxID=1928661 RepID=UPI00142F26E7
MVVHLGYDQKVKLDFSAVANEKITLVRVGEKLIILFDNKSTITVDPVFDSRHDDQHLLSIELAAGRDVNVQEFASLFPITTDQSVLPAAGDGNGNAQGSGASFSNSAVDPLNAGNPLDLLGQESLGTFALGPETFAGLPATTLPSAGFGLSDTIVIHDETLDVQVLNGANDQLNGALPAVFSPVGLIGWAESAIPAIASSSASFGTDGSGTITYVLTTSAGAAFAGVDSGLQATVTGNEIFLFTEGNLVVGREGAGGIADPNGAVAFQLYLDPATLKLDVAQYEAIKHGTASDPDTSEGAQLADVVFVQQTVTDLGGNTATALSSGSLGVSFLDDGPVVTRGEGSELPSLGLLNLDETIGQEDGPQTDRYNIGETESNGITPNGTLDDTGVTSVTVSTAPAQSQAIGELSTPVGGLANLFPAALVDFGTDGPGPDGGVSNVLKLVLSSETVGTNLTATALAGTQLAGLDAAARSIVLVQVNDTTIEGRIFGDGVAGNGDEYVAFRITLENASDPATAHITVDQFLAIDHGGSEDPSVFDEQIFLHLTDAGTLNLQLTTTATDGDGDQASSVVQVNLIGSENTFIAFDDDGPTITREEGEHPSNVGRLNLDETIGQDDSQLSDRYNGSEPESGGGPSNGIADDKATAVTVAIHPTQGQAIGELSTTAGELAELFDAAIPDFGTDGPGAKGGTSNVLKLVLSSDTVDTNLTATALVGSPLANLTASQRAIVLVQVDDNTLEGRIVGDGTAAHEYVAFRITLDDATDPSAATITVDQFLPIDHGGTENPSQFDEQAILRLIGNGTLKLDLTTTAIDGDGDQTSSSVQVTLIGNEKSFIAFDDDGPTVTVSVTAGFAVVHDETLLLQSPPFGDDNDILFTPVFNGVSNPGHDPQVPFGLPIGYAKSDVAALTIENVDYGTDGAAKTGAKVFSLTLTDAQGNSTTGPIDSSITTTGGKEIFLFLEGGLIVGRYDGSDADTGVTNTGNDPAAFAIAIDPISGKVSVVQYVSLHHDSADVDGDIDEAVSLANALGQVKATVTVTDGDGDRASASANIGGDIQFEDDGPLVLATVPHNFGVTADETPNNQANDVDGPLAIFTGVANPGDDPDEPGSVLAYATSSGAALSILPYFGVDGPDPTAAITYSLELNSTDSGVTLTDGTAITLSLDSAGRVIGTVGQDNVHPELTGKTAFAVAIDPDTGKVSVVEYLSLHHFNASNPNDQVSLAAGSISAVVTIKDGDGDTSSASADISDRIHFNDDGPKLTIGTDVTEPEFVALQLNLDETIGQDGSPPDQYNLGEGESGGGAPNGTADDTANVTVTFTTDAASTAEIGELKSGEGLLAPLFTNAVINYGADGPALANPVTSALSLVLTGAPGAGGIKTNLVVTALADSPLDGTSVAHRTVWLTLEGGQIVGRIGHDTQFTGDDAVVLRISLSSTDPATAQLVVDQFLPIDHDASEPAGSRLPENPSLFDEPISLLTAIAGQSVGVKLTVTVTDGDGDHVTKSATATLIDNGHSIVSIDDSGPTISASEDCVDTPLTYVGIKAGNVDQRGLDGPGDQDVLLSGVGQGNGPNPNTINTTGNDIGVGNQSIEGHEVHGGNDQPAEILRLDFVNNVTFPGTFAYNGHYEVDAASFTIHQIQGSANNTATVFVQVFSANDNNNFNDDGSPLAITLNDVTVTGDLSYTKIPVYNGSTLVGVVIVGLNEGATVTVNTTADFNRLVISNYDNVAFSSTPNSQPALPTDPNDPEEVNVGHPFSVSGISSVVCAPATLSVTHDESAGFAPQSGPNPENDVNPATAPSVLTGAIVAANIVTVLGYAESTGAASTLFTTPDFGTDGPGPAGGVSYQLTNSTGGGFTGQDSGLNTTVGNHDIFLFTDSTNPNIVWGVDSNNFQTGEKVFALYVGTDGHLWVAQFAAIAHNLDGSTPAAYDDEVSITNGLVYISATATDGDGDTAHAVSPAGLHINFQDDGPHAFAVASQNVPEGSAPVTGQLDFDPGADGATVTQINGANLSFGNDGYSQAISIAHGSLQVTADGAYKFVAQPDDVYKTGGPANFTYTVTDGDGDKSGSTISFVVTDDSDPTKVTLNDVTVNEGVGTATISASVDHAPQGSDLVLTLSNGATITIHAGQTTGTSTPFAVQGDDPYVDHGSYPVSVTGATGGNYELLDTTDTATVTVNDTDTPTTVNLSASTVQEGPSANYVFTATLSNVSHGDTVITTDQGTITIHDGQTIGTLTVAPVPPNGEDPYLDSTSLTATITNATGGNFESLVVGTGSATAHINDTITTNFVTLHDVVVLENQTIVYTAQLDYAPIDTPFTVTLNNGVVITFDPGHLTASSGPQPAQGEDVYLDGGSTQVWIASASGGNFEKVDFTKYGTATLTVNDTVDDTTVSLSASTVQEGPSANYVFTATLSNVSHGDTIVTTDRGTITIHDGQTIGTLTVAPVPPNGEDPYLDSTSLTATITNATGGDFENLVVGTGSATAHINDTITTNFVTLHNVVVLENETVVYSAHMDYASLTTFTVTLNNGVEITFEPGHLTASSDPQPAQGDDVYLDGDTSLIWIASTSGGNFEKVDFTKYGTATLTVNDTVDDTTVSLSASTVQEGPSANYVFTATLSNVSHGDTVVTTDRGTITIHDGQTTGTLTIPSGNGEDVYLDGSQLTATISSATGGNFEKLTIGTASATAQVTDTLDPTTVNLSASTVQEGAIANYVFTATLSNVSHGDTVVTTDRGIITIGDGQTTGTLTIPSGNGEDVYLDGSQLTATISNATGGNFENLVVGTGSATAHVGDTIDTTTVNLSASTVQEGAIANYVFTATLSNVSHGDTVITTDQGIITIGDGQTTGTLTIPSGNGEDVYLDGSQLTATISNATGGNFENLVVGTGTATAQVTDTLNPVTATLTTSTTSISEYGGSITYTVTLSSGLSPFTPNSPLDVLLSNGEHVMIAANASSGSVTRTYSDAEITNQASIADSIDSVSGGGQYEQLLTAGTTTVPVVYSPTIAIGPNNGLPEDTQEGIQFTASVGSSSHVTQIVVSGLAGWTVDATAANLALTGGGGTASVSSASFSSGVLTINITGAADGAAVTAAVLMSPPLNSDVDAVISMTATAAQGATTATSAATPGTIYVDAVADAPAPVTGQSHIIFVKDSASDSNSAFSNGETGSLQVKAMFGDVHDGSETHVLDIHLQTGFTASLAASGTIAGTYNGVSTNFSYTYSSGTGNIHIIVPNDTALNPNAGQTATIDLSIAVMAPSTGALPDNLNFSITATSTEATLSGGGVGVSNAELTTDNVATFVDSTAIPAARLLTGAFKTNTNNTVQEAILSFIDEAQPLDAFAQLLTFQGQGQASTFTGDAGFNITGTHTFEVVLEAAFTATTQINVTDFKLNGVTMDKASGATTKIEYLLTGSTAEALTSEIVPDGSHNSDTYVNSQDGSDLANSLAGTSVNGNYVYGFSGNDTLAGGGGNTFLNGGAGADTITGGSKNDVIVFDTNDTSVNGDAGFDILRIDEGAIYNTSFQVSGAPTGGLSSANSHVTNGVRLYDVDLSTENLSNLEAILLTAEASASSSFGTELHGLTAANVVTFTGGAGAINSQTGTANTLFVIGSAGDDVELTNFSETATTYTSAGGQVFHQWVSTAGPAATLFIDNDLQVNHAAQA